MNNCEARFLLRIFASDPAFNRGHPFEVCTVAHAAAENYLIEFHAGTPHWHWSIQNSPVINTHATSQIKSPHKQASDQSHREGRGRKTHAVRFRATEQAVAEVSREAPVEARRLGLTQPAVADGARVSDRLTDLASD